MSHLAQVWGVKVERGPDCLIIRLQMATTTSQDGERLADVIWSILERHFTYRVIVELDQVEEMCDYLLGELVALSHRLRSRGGMLRLCGLSPRNRRKLKEAREDGRLPSYPNRHDAMVGHSAAMAP
jgi:anti-anti-sigma regulatory factor